MIWEAWQYVKTHPQFKYAKKMGYVTESIAMLARAKRCQAQWASHYAHCQQAIRFATERAVQHRTVLIFGAGSLQDIPLEWLAQKFSQVILVDLVFIAKTEKQAQVFPNVTLVEHDVTESLEWISAGEHMVQTPRRWLDQKEVDLVISLNLITQLPLIPVRWLMQDFKLSETEADILGKQLIYAHLHYLQSFAGEVCLIADREDIEYDSQGNEVERFDPWWDVEPPAEHYDWIWEVVPLAEADSNNWQKNRVAVSFL